MKTISVARCGSIQKAIDYIGPLGADLDGFPEGNTVYFPPGEYVISAGSSAAGLTVINNNAMLLGDGGAPNGTKLLLDGPAAGILIEGAQGFPTPHEALARGARLSGLAIYKKPGGNTAQDAVVVHAPFVSISDCVIAGAARHGILIESGTSVSGALLGMTTAPSSTYFNSNGWRISNVFVGVRQHGWPGTVEQRGGCLYPRQ